MQAVDTITDLEQQVEYLKKALKDAEEHRQRQIRVGNCINCNVQLINKSFILAQLFIYSLVSSVYFAL